jgi:hypothetical protein
MAEPAPARGAAPAQWPIKVSLSGAPAPLTTNAAITDTIAFTVSPPPGVYLWTYDPDGTAANIFVGETGNYVQLQVGVNPALSFNTNVVHKGDTCTFEANSAPPNERAARGPHTDTGVKGTINIKS